MNPRIVVPDRSGSSIGCGSVPGFRSPGRRLPFLTSSLRTAFEAICGALTEFLGSWAAAYDVPPAATSSATKVMALWRRKVTMT
jgi:hypothetical protein